MPPGSILHIPIKFSSAHLALMRSALQHDGEGYGARAHAGQSESGGDGSKGSALSIAAIRNARDQVVQIDLGKTSSDRPWKRQARLLTLGYIGHAWELFGAWAWIPAFLAASLLSQGRMTGVEVGLWIAVTLHVSGFFGSFLSGYAADRFGAKPVLVSF